MFVHKNARFAYGCIWLRRHSHVNKHTYIKSLYSIKKYELFQYVNTTCVLIITVWQWTQTEEIHNHQTEYLVYYIWYTLLSHFKIEIKLYNFCLILFLIKINQRIIIRYNCVNKYQSNSWTN